MPIAYAIYLAIIVASYLLGAIPFMILIGKLKGIDLAQEADLHHALWYKVGRGWGILGFLLDVLKGVIPVLSCYIFNLPLLVASIAGMAALCGQMWPVFRKFNGERGNTTGLGASGTLSVAYGAPLILVMALAFAVMGFVIRTLNRWRTSGDSLNERLKFGGPPSLALPLGVILGFASTPFTSIILGKPPEMTSGLAGVVVLILIRRLTADVRQDLAKDKSRWWSVLLNRLLFDRSEI